MGKRLDSENLHAAFAVAAAAFAADSSPDIRTSAESFVQTQKEASWWGEARGVGAGAVVALKSWTSGQLD